MMNYVKTAEIKAMVRQVLKEDLGSGDITTKKTVPKNIKIKAVIVAKESGILCGIDIARIVFAMRDKRIKFLALARDGDKVTKGRALAKIFGLASSILSCERAALNFLGFLSGIATRTRQFIEQSKPYQVKILDTRKTLPLLRKLEKYAVRIGGGFNHRQSLDAMVLIKDNHLKIKNSCLPVRQARFRLQNLITDLRKKIPRNMKIEVEADSLKEFKEALKGKPDIIMLDNMAVRQVKKAVQLRNKLRAKYYQPAPKLEASGNINLKSIRAYAATGVDFISLGTLTKDIQSLDISLEVRSCPLN